MILRAIAKLLIQEHRHRPITGRVLQLGPQTMPMTPPEVDALFTEDPLARSRFARPVTQSDCATDEYFWKNFPIDSLESLDVMAGFGGSIIHDLNHPVPTVLQERFDFILDGGTFDHLLNVGVAFQSVARMLKPGGRVFHYNAASNYIGTAYMMFGPDLFFDYYVANAFADCQVYVARAAGPEWELFFVKGGRSKDLNSCKNQMVIALAEKAGDSTWERFPIEHAYRGTQLRDEYARLGARVQESTRPLFTGDRRWGPRARETRYFLLNEWRSARKRWRAGKFDFQKIRTRRAKTTYTYVGFV